MSAWAPPSVTHHRAWHARGSCRPHISLQRRERRSTVMSATFFCCPFSGPCVFQTPRGSSLCSITHITIMPGLPHLEYSRSSASDSHLYSQAQMLLEDTGPFHFLFGLSSFRPGSQQLLCEVCHIYLLFQKQHWTTILGIPDAAGCAGDGNHRNFYLGSGPCAKFMV